MHPNAQPSDSTRTLPRQESAPPPSRETSFAFELGSIHAALPRSGQGEWRGLLWQAMTDAFEGAVRVARTTRRPTRKGILHFLSHQMLINAVAWTAGLASAGLVTSFFERKGLRNLWGLAGSGSRTIVSAEDYRLILTLTSFLVGLSMMMFVRHFALRWVEETRCVRLERAPASSPSGPRPSPVGLATDFAELEPDNDQ